MDSPGKRDAESSAGPEHDAIAGRAADGHPPWPRTIAVLGLVAGCFSFLEMAILPTLPLIQRQLAGANTTLTALLESGFLIVAAVAAPLFGKFGDCRGKRNMLLVTLGVYFVGALGAGLAPDFVVLILFRALQGVGGALMLLSIAMTRDEVPPDRLSVGIGWIVGSFGMGACLGLGVSGIITEIFSWRYIFFAECVLILLGGVLVVAFVPQTPQRGAQRMDYPGVALLGAALASLIMGLTEVLQLGWPVAGLFTLSMVLFVAWILYERHTEEPLLDVRILASPRVLLPNLGSGLAGYAAFGTFFLVPRFVQVPRHLPPHIAQQLHYGFGAGVTTVGLYLLPLGVGLTCAGPSGGTIGRHFGGKGPFAGGLALVVLACALLAFVHQNRFEFGAWLFLLGAGFGMSIGAGNVFVAEAVEQSLTGIAVSFNSLMRLIAGGIGAQIAAILIRSHGIGGSQAAGESAFVIAFGISALLALVGVGIALLVPTD